MIGGTSDVFTITRIGLVRKPRCSALVTWERPLLCMVTGKRLISYFTVIPRSSP